MTPRPGTRPRPESISRPRAEKPTRQIINSPNFWYGVLEWTGCGVGFVGPDVFCRSSAYINTASGTGRRLTVIASLRSTSLVCGRFSFNFFRRFIFSDFFHAATYHFFRLLGTVVVFFQRARSNVSLLKRSRRRRLINLWAQTRRRIFGRLARFGSNLDFFFWEKIWLSLCNCDFTSRWLRLSAVRSLSDFLRMKIFAVVVPLMMN